MKKILLGAMALLLALPLFAQNSEAYPSFVQVNGRAQLEVTPDEFYLTILLDENRSKGRVPVEEQRRQMTAALRKLGVDPAKQLKMADLSSEAFRRNGSLTTARYELLLHSPEEVSAAYEALQAVGIPEISLTRVTHSQIDDYKEQVRAAAILNARHTAETLAGALGQRVGKCFYIYDSNYDATSDYYAPRLMRAKAESNMDVVVEEVALEFRALKLDYSVQAKFVLE